MNILTQLAVILFLSIVDVRCSRYGFCGTTPDFCTSSTVTAPLCARPYTPKRIGYYESWAIRRPRDRMYPEGIPLGTYTHLNFAFAVIHPTTFAVAPMHTSDRHLYNRFTALKSTNTGLQTWISIGGWSMKHPDDQSTAGAFSTLARSTDAQCRFFASVLSFLETYGFDGVDLASDWGYPVAPERSGHAADFTNYVTFLQNFRIALHSSGHNYGLTITIPSSARYMQHIDIISIEKTIDWFNVISEYDLHSTWDLTNRSLAPYTAAHMNLTEIDSALSLLWQNIIDPGNVVLGLGFYGRSFTLADPSCTTVGCQFTARARAGNCTQSVGTLSYAEIERIVARGATVVKDDAAAVKMVVYDTDQWVSYDDAETLSAKVDYANAHRLGGTIVWAVSADNANGSAAAALLSATGTQAISLRSTTGSDPLMLCQLGDCGQPCPVGLSPAQRNDGKNKGDSGSNTGCPGGALRLYCCPATDMPTCTWRGQAPFCGMTGGNKCNSTEVEVTSSTSGTGQRCWTGHKVLCCTKTGSDSALGHCGWQGSSPFCSGLFSQASCPFAQQALTKSNYGAGGEQVCLWGQKSLCCDQPPPYTGCDWYYHGGSHWWHQIPFQCTSTCPAGKAVIATDPSWCWSGYGAFCCDNPSTLSDPLIEDFKRRISTFANNPTCTVRPPRRDVPANLSLSRMSDFEKRASLSNDDFTLLLQQLSQIARGGGTSRESLMASQFNLLYGDRYGLYIADLATFYADWPSVDSLLLSKTLLCMGGNASDFLSNYHQGRNQLCVNPCTVPRRRDIISSNFGLTATVNKTVLFARNLAESEINLALGPDALMMDAIINGLMSLEYEQIFLTLVWRLPPGDGPGVVDSTYQDSNPLDSETNPDVYIVFHFHTEHIATIAGAPRPGIYAVAAFHGQSYDPNTGRVNGRNRDGRNRRAHVMNCNTGSASTPKTFFFYPGEYTNQQAADLQPWAQIVTEFGNYLVEQELVTAATFTGTRQGQLQLAKPDPCGRRYFLWNEDLKSRQFGPDGAPPPGGGKE